ncbi:ankyrin repeat-containing protein NPR4-like [Pyrus communis]|uniref:ankyrin repeat-containing protein NPR4-like n=1 Tax=Pyrus communis TaxID=23211 RepID=UPI0035C02579
MDTSNMADQSESPITPLESTDVGDQIEQADQSQQTDIQEATNLEGNNSTVLIRRMDRDVFNAAKQGNLDILKEHGENLDKILTATKNTILHIYTACYSRPTNNESEDEILKSTNTVEDILKMCPALLWLQNESGDTALHIAARYGRAGIVRALLAATETSDVEQGSEKQKLIRKTNKKKDTALHEAARFNYFGVGKILTEADPEFSYSANDAGEAPLYLAVERGNTHYCLQILEGCKNPTYEGPNGRTALHAAVLRNDEVMTRELLKSGRTLAKAADERGIIPLHMAAKFGYLSMVKQLWECDKSTAYVADNDGCTALHFAASKGHLDIMKELLTCCPDCCELVNNECQNVLHYAIKRDQNHVVHFVLTDLWLSNILLNGKDVNGNAPLHYLANYPTYKMDALLLDPKVDIMSFNKENLNALDVIQANEDKISKALELEELKRILHSRGARKGHRIKNPVEEDQRTKKNIGESLQKAKETHLVVAALIATVTFAAGFTMPGGYQSEIGPDQGSAVLSRSAAFKAFVITDTLAMAMSSCSVLVLLYSSIHTKWNHMDQESVTFHMVVSLTMWALMAMVVAFITGTYAVLGGHSPGLAVAACVLGCIIFFVFAHSLLSTERKILKAPHFLIDMVGGYGLMMVNLLIAIIKRLGR